MTISETDYLRFTDNTPPDRKTKVVAVWSTRIRGVRLGEIYWFGRWRQYAFFPSPDTVWSRDCLLHVAAEVEKLNTEWRELRVAQTAEHRAHNPAVAGSKPAAQTSTEGKS